MRVDIWSGVAWPWCYVGKARSSMALDSLAHRFDMSLGVSGVQATETFSQALEQAWPLAAG